MNSRRNMMSPLNEELLGRDNEEQEDDVEVVGTMPMVDAKEHNNRRKRRKIMSDRFKDFDDNMKDFIDDSMRREIDTKLKEEKDVMDGKMKLEESLFQKVNEAEPPKKRPRAENEKKWIGDYSSEDLWLAVYDELSATLDNEGSGKQVDKQIKARRGERYEHVYPDGDNDIVVYATKPEEFAFAKKVCDHYGVTFDEPKLDTNKRTNGFYKYSMVIHIPEEGLYQGE